MQELAITPFGASLGPVSTPVADWNIVLNHVLNALVWPHCNNIIHRDTPWDNIIWDGNNAILIDLGASAHLTSSTMTVPSYRGGNICCPPRLIGDFEREHVPVRADDCHAFVLLVLMLLFPQCWMNVHSPQTGMSGSMVATMMSAFWTAMEKSKVWEQYVQAAVDADYACLREMVECCVYYGSPVVELEDQRD